MTLKYQLSDYINLLQMTNRKHLLVEGKNDQRIFRIMIDEFKKNTSNEEVKIDIDIAQDLVDFGVMLGNREKVEMVCQNIIGKPGELKIVGFVDREFREFELQPDLIDKVLGHKVNGRLVWSRGHSIENYYFEFLILRNPLRDLGIISNFESALLLYEKIFDSIIRLACAASLAAHELKNYSMIRASIDWKVFQINSQKIMMNYNEWRNRILENGNTSQLADQILDKFRKWDTQLQTADLAIVRWICHGHIGIKTMWEAYAKCVAETSSKNGDNPESQARDVLRANERLRLNLCSNAWTSNIISNKSQYPSEILTLLGVSNLLPGSNS